MHGTIRMKHLLPLLLLILLLGPSCKKEEGEGGLANIRGVVLRQDINNNTGQPQGDPYPYQETRVYIVYGDHDVYDDDVRTGPDGQYGFSWLRKGNYTIYTYSECDNCPGGQEVVERAVTIGDKKETVTVPTITVDNW